MPTHYAQTLSGSPASAASRDAVVHEVLLSASVNEHEAAVLHNSATLESGSLKRSQRSAIKRPPPALQRPAGGAAMPLLCHGCCSISALVIVIAVVLTAVCVAVVFTSTVMLLQRNVDEFLTAFGDNAASQTAFVVHRHFEAVKTFALLAQRLASQEDLLATWPYPTSILRWFGSSAILLLNIHFVLASASVDGYGYSIGPYSAFVPADFPQRTGAVAVTLFNASQNFVDVGYFDMTDVHAVRPVNQTAPFRRYHNITFNFSTRVYAASMFDTFSWTPAYVGVLTRTSAVGIGGPYYAATGGIDDAPLGSFSFHDYTEDVVQFLAKVKISRTGKVILIHTPSSAFIGGNIIDNSTTTVTLPLSGSSVRRLVYIEELTDQSVRPVTSRHGRLLVAANATANPSACSALDNACVFLFDPRTSALLPRGSASWWFALFTDYSMVRVVPVTVSHGLHLRMILILRSSDFCDNLRTAASEGIMISLLVIGALIVSVAAGTHVLLSPLRTAAETVSTLMDPSRQRSRSIEQSMQKHLKCSDDVSDLSHSGCSVAILELEVVRRALSRLISEMNVIYSFLPSSVLDLPSSDTSCAVSQQAHALSRSDSVASHIPLVGLLHLTEESQRIEVAEMQHAEVRALPRGDVSFLHGTDVQLGDSAGFENMSPLINRPDDSSDAPRFLLSATAHALSSFTAVPYRLGGRPWLSPVTFVVGDIRGFTKLRDAMLPSSLAALHAQFLNVVQAAAADHGGVLHGFYGDHVYLHFNAERRVKKHAESAALAVLQIQANTRVTVSSVMSSPLTACFGVSTSHAVCGMMGPRERLRTFQVIGVCVQQAATLCQQSKLDDQNALVSWRSARLIRSQRLVLLQHVRLAVLPYENATTVVSIPIRVSDLQNVRLVDRRSGQPITNIPEIINAVQINNAAHEAVAQGDVARATRLLLDSPWSREENWLASHLL